MSGFSEEPKQGPDAWFDLSNDVIEVMTQDLKDHVQKLLPDEKDRISWEFPPLILRIFKKEVFAEAVKATKDDLRKFLASRKAPATSGAAMPVDSDEDDVDSDSDDDFKIVKVYVRGREIDATNNQDEARVYDRFIEKLPKCVALYLGFFSIPIFAGMDEWCYCPCGRHMKTWRGQFNLQSILDESVVLDQCARAGGGCMSPRGLVAHLEKKMEDDGKDEGGILHRIVYDFLKNLTLHWLGCKDLNHAAFYGLNTSNARVLASAEAQEWRSLMRDLSQSLKARQKALRDLRTTVKQAEEDLSKINKDLNAAVQKAALVEHKFLHELGIQKPCRVQYDDVAIQEFHKKGKAFYDLFRRMWRARRTNEYRKAEIGVHSLESLNKEVKKKGKKGKQARRDGFCLQNLFHKLMESEKSNENGTPRADKKRKKQSEVEFGSRSDKSVLTKTTDDTDAMTSVQTQTALRGSSRHKYHLFSDIAESSFGVFLEKWEIIFGEAGDEGGPTRQFLSGTWNQMNALEVQTVQCKDGSVKKVKLFEQTDAGVCYPVDDEFILKDCRSEREKSEVTRRCKLYYRAIGRIMAQCLAQGHCIAAEALTQFYIKFLLCGIGPSDKDEEAGCYTYHSYDLFMHIGEMYGWQKWARQNSDAQTVQDGSHWFDAIITRCLIGWSADSNDQPLGAAKKQEVFRRLAQENLIDNRRIAIDGLQQGISLGGFVEPSECFRDIPLEAITRFVFSKQGSMSVEDVLDVLEVTYDMDCDLDCQRRVIAVDTEGEAGSKTVTGYLVDLFRQKEDEERQARNELTTLMEEIGRSDVPKDQRKINSRLDKVAKRNFVADFVHFASGSLFIPDSSSGFKLTIEFNSREMTGDSLPVSHSCDCLVKLPGTAYVEYEDCFAALSSKLKTSVESSVKYSFGMG